MPERNDLADALAGHAGWNFNDITDDYECVCGDRLGHQCQSDYAANRALWKHQADAILAAGWTKSRITDAEAKLAVVLDMARRKCDVYDILDFLETTDV